MGLITTVHVHKYPTGENNVFGPGDDIPEWAAVQIGAHCFSDGEHPIGEVGVTAPPKAGPGSGADAWRQYAATHGVDVPGDAKREEIISALTDAGIAVDQA